MVDKTSTSTSTSAQRAAAAGKKTYKGAKRGPKTGQARKRKEGSGPEANTPFGGIEVQRQAMAHVGEQADPTPGSRLVTLIEAHVQLNGFSYASFCEEQLGVTYSYIRALSRGSSSWGNVSSSLMRRIAQALGLPLPQIYMLADVILPEDTIAQQTIEQYLTRTHMLMSSDPVWAGYVPPMAIWSKLDRQTQILIARLYEAKQSRLSVDFGG